MTQTDTGGQVAPRLTRDETHVGSLSCRAHDVPGLPAQPVRWLQPGPRVQPTLWLPPVRSVLWRLSDLLHVPHGAYINAKMRAKQAAGVA